MAPEKASDRPERILRPMRRPFAVLLALTLLATLVGACSAPTGAGPDRPVKILTGAADTLDPAVQGDAGSAAIMAQLFETLTTVDADLHLQPALAASGPSPTAAARSRSTCGRTWSSPTAAR